MGRQTEGSEIYRISNFSHGHAVSDGVVRLWTTEAGLTAAEAQRRLGEVLLVATDPDGGLAGVSTAYLAHDERLRTDLWHVRVFVARARRRGDIGRRLLRECFAALEERGGAGVLIEVENAAVRHAERDAIWPTTRFAFIGENARGAHVRVRYFGAAADTVAGVPGEWTTERLRGRLDEAWSERILRFWLDNGALDETEGRRRLPQVVCALLDPHGEIAGVSSAYPAEVPLIGGRRFWVYRNFVLPSASEAAPALVAATFETLESEFDPGGEDPIGLCLLLAPEQAERRPEAVWENPTLLYAGHLEDGRQVRVGYFAGATVVRG